MIRTLTSKRCYPEETGRREVSMDVNLGDRNFDELIGMFAQAPIGLCCFDRTLRFVYVNGGLGHRNGPLGTPA